VTDKFKMLGHEYSSRSMFGLVSGVAQRKKQCGTSSIDVLGM